MVKPQHLVIGRRAEQRARGPERYSPHRRGGAKSFVDDLVLGRGVVLSRAATSLRSIETQPWTRRFVRYADGRIFPGLSDLRASMISSSSSREWERGAAAGCGTSLSLSLSPAAFLRWNGVKAVVHVCFLKKNNHKVFLLPAS